MLDENEDSKFFQKQRVELVNALRNKGISDEKVLEAINTVPRHLFMSPQNIRHAYVDKAFPIGEGQTISQPFTVAYQTQLLKIEPGDKVLEIGTGSGYQASVLAVMGCDVYSVERQKKLFDKSQESSYLKQLPNLHLFFRDGYNGLTEYAPFDKILVTAAAPQVPDELVAQLKMPGIMVLPLGVRPTQIMLRINKLENGDTVEENLGNFSFVPMVRGRQ